MRTPIGACATAHALVAWGLLILADNTEVRADAGDLDPSFGSGGVALAVGPGGKPVVAGSDFPLSLPEFTLYRFSADGAPDASFGGFGSVTHPISEVQPTARGVALQSDGKK